MKSFLLTGLICLFLIVVTVGSAPRVSECSLDPVQFNQLLGADRHPQVLDISRRVDLKRFGTYELDSLVTGERLLQVGCIVTEPVMGAPLADFRVVGVLANNIRIYDDANHFFPGFNTLGGLRSFAQGDGSQVDDRFVLNLPVTVNRPVTVEISVDTPATSGAMQCIVWATTPAN